MSCTNCTMDHKCNQGRGCLHVAQGFKRINTSYQGPERRIPFDNKLATAVLVVLLALWLTAGVLVAAQ